MFDDTRGFSTNLLLLPLAVTAVALRLVRRTDDPAGADRPAGGWEAAWSTARP